MSPAHSETRISAVRPRSLLEYLGACYPEFAADRAGDLEGWFREVARRVERVAVRERRESPGSSRLAALELAAAALALVGAASSASWDRAAVLALRDTCWRTVGALDLAALAEAGRAP